MVAFIMGNGIMAKEMDLENNIGQTEHIMRENGVTIKYWGMAGLFMQMEMPMFIF
jgi:hypothetical protein